MKLKLKKRLIFFEELCFIKLKFTTKIIYFLYFCALSYSCKLQFIICHFKFFMDRLKMKIIINEKKSKRNRQIRNILKQIAQQ